MLGIVEVDLPKYGQNADLVWELEAIQQRRRAHEFVMHFENKLCVFSGSVEQVYTNYSIFFPPEEHRRMVILPNPNAHFDTCQGVTEEAVKPTGLFIVPNDNRELMLRIPLKGGHAFRDIPLHAGIKLVNSRRPTHLPLLPVLMKGDLRELDARTPCLHLHALSLSQLKKLSIMEINSMRQAILKRLDRL